MAREALFNKWRPSSFQEVSGHVPVVQTLRNSIESGKISHSYMFAGPRGTGKTTLARILSKAVNCEAFTEGDVCNSCNSCLSHDASNAIDLIEIDSGTHGGVDDIRTLSEKVLYAPNVSRYKVYVFDEAHALSSQGFTALLKHIEEPPPHVIFIFATTEADRVLTTIQSRSQRFDLGRLSVSDIVHRLREISASEKFSLSDGVLELLARYASGSLRDAVNALDRVTAAYGDLVTEGQARENLGLNMDQRALDLSKYIIFDSLPDALKLINVAVADGLNIRKFAEDVVLVLRALLFSKAGILDALVTDQSYMDQISEILAEEDTTVDKLIMAMDSLSELGTRKFMGDEFNALPLELVVAKLSLSNRTSNEYRTDENSGKVDDDRITKISPVQSDKQDETPDEPAGAAVSEIAQTEDTDFSDYPDRTPTVSSPVTNIETQWLEIRQMVRDKSRPAEALLSNARPRDITSENFEVGFRYEAHLQNFLDRKKQIAGVVPAEVLDEAVSAVLGADIQVTYSHWPDLGEKNSSDDIIEPQTNSSGGHLVSEALNLGGQLIETPEE